MFETIVALATPPMKSALAIIRVSGDDCFEIVSKCFSKDLTKITERTIQVGYILDKKKDLKIDQVVLAIYKGPNSFTGEDSIEIICHGNLLISQQILDILIENGARMARKLAKDVQKTKTTYTFDPMPADERRAIHNACSNMSHIKTESIGEGKTRQVQIIYVE